jgi:fumarate reductase subunit C
MSTASPGGRQPAELAEPAGRVGTGPYRPRTDLLWWVHRRSYVLFVLRELSSVFVAWFVVHLVLLVVAVHGGSEQYARFLEWSARPWVAALNVVALAFVVLHAVTWFTLAPKALVVRVRGRRLPARMVAASHFGAWAVASAVVVLIVLGGW